MAKEVFIRTKPHVAVGSKGPGVGFVQRQLIDTMPGAQQFNGTYYVHEATHVLQARGHAGVQTDGIVGSKTWGAAQSQFQGIDNQATPNGLVGFSWPHKAMPGIKHWGNPHVHLMKK